MRYPDFTSVFDFHRPKDCPNRFCRTHFYYDFDAGYHLPFPNEWSYLSSLRGWMNVTVYCGPGAWFPKKPTQEQMTNMVAYCPHTQGDLTCNTCLRHTFRLLEI